MPSLGVWRLCQDVGLAGDFVFADGFLSHWQVWIAAAGLMQYTSWRLSRYGGSPAKGGSDAGDGTGSEDPKRPRGLAANV